jgi:hypothetical protein
MNITILQGHFPASDTMDLLTQFIHVKIKYHERKIEHLDNEEDIKMREKRIQQLQKELHELRTYVEKKGNQFELKGVIEVN